MKCFHLLWLCLIGSPLIAATGDENWQRFPLPEGLNGEVIRLLPAGDKLYATGNFTEADGQSATGIAEWDGSKWSPIAVGLEGRVFAVAAHGNNLYIGGTFTIPAVGVTNLAIWDGTHWRNPGAVINREPSLSCFGSGSVYALAWQEQSLFVGGTFDSAGGVPATNIAVLNGRNWEALDDGIGGSCDDNGFGMVFSIAVSGNKVYAGGLFHRAGSSVATNIACWDGVKWSGLGSGLDTGPSQRINYENGQRALYSGTVYDLRFRGTELFAGGEFSKAGDDFVGGVAVWDGHTWASVGGGVKFADNRYVGIINHLLFDGRDLIVAGSFDRAGAVDAASIARWDGKIWSAFGKGLSAPVEATALWKGDLFVGGAFGIAGDQQAPFIARWESGEWHPLHSGTGEGLFGYTFGIATSDAATFAVGELSSAGSQRIQNVAAWNGTHWSNLGEGLVGTPQGAAVLKSNLYVIGPITVPAVGATNIARWDGNRWHSVPLPTTERFPLSIRVVADQDHLYALGSAGDRVFSWDGDSWSELRGSIFASDGGCSPCSPTFISTLSARNGRLAAVGRFKRFGSASDATVALWDGTGWCALDDFTSSVTPYLPAFVADDLYVMSYDAQTSKPLLSRWNQSGWVTVPTFLPSQGFPYITGTDRNLYVSGRFTEIGGVRANSIARFDGTNWFPLGSGLDAPAYPIAVFGDRLVCAGNFTRAGGNSSYRFAIWEEPGPRR